MRNFKQLQELIDKYYKSYDEDGNEIDDKASEYYDDIITELNYLIDWDEKYKEIMDEINQLRKELKTHTHQKGTVYVKL